MRDVKNLVPRACCRLDASAFSVGATGAPHWCLVVSVGHKEMEGMFLFFFLGFAFLGFFPRKANIPFIC